MLEILYFIEDGKLRLSVSYLASELVCENEDKTDESSIL